MFYFFLNALEVLCCSNQQFQFSATNVILITITQSKCLLHCKNTSVRRVLFPRLARWGLMNSPPWLKTRSTGAEVRNPKWQPLNQYYTHILACRQYIDAFLTAIPMFSRWLDSMTHLPRLLDVIKNKNPRSSKIIVVPVHQPPSWISRFRISWVALATMSSNQMTLKTWV